MCEQNFYIYDEIYSDNQSDFNLTTCSVFLTRYIHLQKHLSFNYINSFDLLFFMYKLLSNISYLGMTCCKTSIMYANRCTIKKNKCLVYYVLRQFKRI